MFEALRVEITARMPKIEDAARKRVEEAKDSKGRLEAVKQISGLEKFLENNSLDAKLSKFFILNEATPAGLTAYAEQGDAHRKLIDYLLANEKLMFQIAVADGARPVHSPGKGPYVGPYGRVMENYIAIQKASPKAREGVLQRLALAVSLEYSEQDAIDRVKPLERYLHYEKAYLSGELDPNFDRLSVWELRFVVCSPRSNEALAWGREMLRNFRPDHIYTENQGWRYANVVNTDVRYGSIDVHKDRPELMDMQNILMNGGICGRRAFFARYICRAFGIPATARPSSGHGASARWTPDGWVVVLGPGWRHGWTATRYHKDLDFLATTQARARGKEFLKVKRAYWMGDVVGEERCYAEFDAKAKPAFWNAVSLATQRRIIEESKAVTLDALGTELGEASGETVAEKIAASAITPEARQIAYGTDGTINIPAACAKTDDEEKDVVVMKSFGGGLQVFLPRFLQQKPILVRGGTYKHEADLCASATRHWRGRRPKTSGYLRGIRLAMTPNGDETPKEMKVEIADGVTMDFVYIKPGNFIMGGDREEISKDRVALADVPKHEVTLTSGFYLGRFEVTQAQYESVMGKPAKVANEPISGVKPFTALLFCDEITARTGLDVRLPTEAEWEHAARAGTDTRWFFGDDPSKLGEYAWFKNNSGDQAHPVGLKKPNPWGLYDIYGNIGEFVRDEHSEDYYANSPEVDPTGPLLGIHSSMQYTLTVPKSGTYSMTARMVTSNVEQSLQLAVNGGESVINVELPFTIGAWGDSEPVTLDLKQGENSLHFWRDKAPQYGVAIKSFTLKPVRNE